MRIIRARFLRTTLALWGRGVKAQRGESILPAHDTRDSPHLAGWVDREGKISVCHHEKMLAQATMSRTFFCLLLIAAISARVAPEETCSERDAGAEPYGATALRFFGETIGESARACERMRIHDLLLILRV